MLKIEVKPIEYWDAKKNEFVMKGEKRTIYLEHSLVSISKWEAKWGVSFISKLNEQSNSQIADYIKCMTITQNVPDDLYLQLTADDINKINEYIGKPMTATTFSSSDNGKNRDIITSELIYYWMISHNIPMECQKWHLNRLLVLIRICSIKNAPEKKTNKKDLINKYASLNAQRRQQLNTKG